MSAILSVDDLNDFISPGVACIKPVETIKTRDANSAQIQISMEGVPTEVSESGQSTTLEKAQISLSDCLACSGCITSAESVLVSLQSHDELLSSLQKDESKNKCFVASISHQVRVSLAAAFNISLEKVDAKLQHLFVDILGFKYYVGMEVGRLISLHQSLSEVKMRRADQTKAPVLCSVCPGWTCYVEKTHPHIIPYLSNVKSPQQITGTLLKDMISKELQIPKDMIYHLSIMPCFDKKLEAARPEFGMAEEENEFRDVDCVITAKEIVLLLLEKNITFESLDDTSTDSLNAPSKWPTTEQWLSHYGSSSGGYLDYILSGIQNEVSLPTHIQTIHGRNADIVELRVVSDENENEVFFRAARIYGFRNIQNLVRKLKPDNKAKRAGRVSAGGANAAVRAKVTARARKTSRLNSQRNGDAGDGEGNDEGNSLVSLSDPAQYDYVEVMACPGGCINGGGLIGVPEGKNQKEWKQQLEDLYLKFPQIESKSMSFLNFVELKTNEWVSNLWDASQDTKDYSLLNVEYHGIDDAMKKTPEEINASALGSRW